jgi:hypothetical protein
MTTLLWLRLHVDSKVDNASKKHTVSIFRAEDGSVPNETKGMGTVWLIFVLNICANNRFMKLCV